MTRIHFSRRRTASRAQLPYLAPQPPRIDLQYFFFVSTHLVFVVATCMSLGVSSLSAAAGAKMLSSGSPEIAHLTFRAFAMSSLTT